MRYAARPIAIVACWTLAACAPAQIGTIAPADPPPVSREFRAAWIATVNNIDWPSRPGLPTEQQQSELRAIMDRAVALNLNALILQVRPATDALYNSTIEPWSPYLTGKMGQAPEPFYDPLEFAVAEAHKRGLELHAWFNPFRAKHATFRDSISANHISRTHPHLVRAYGRSLWLDPGDPDVHRQSLAVILDVVHRYDIDGVHIDDYFYPYQERDTVSNALIPFPDDETFTLHGGGVARDDWRRQNVDRFVAEMYAAVRATKSHVKVGISPFGIWRPGNPPGVTGFDAYSSIYADARKWLNNGWLDYFSPQLYWRSDSPGQNYTALLSWWVAENAHGRHMWPGNFTSRTDTVEGPQTWRAGELLRQIALTRAVRGATGNVHFSMRALMRNRDSLADVLARGPYAEPALVPASRWLDSIPPPAPKVYLTTESGESVAQIRPGDVEVPAVWRVSARHGAVWRTTIVAGTSFAHRLGRDTSQRGASLLWVTAVDRAGNESAPTVLQVR